MNSKNKMTLALGAAIALVISAGAAYGAMGQTAREQSTYTGGVAAGLGYGGGMMGGYGGSSYPGATMGGGYGGIMGGFGGTMGQFSQFMGGHWGNARDGAASGAFVAIANYGFYPATLDVVKGTTVTWVNMDLVQHTVTSGTDQAPTGLFDSHELSHMQSFSYTFTAPGTYVYYCDIHPGMTGTIVVT